MLHFSWSILHAFSCIFMAVGSAELVPDTVHTCPSGRAHGNSQLQVSSGVLETQDEIKNVGVKFEGAGKRFQGARKKTTEQLEGVAVGLHNSTAIGADSACRARCDAMEHALKESRLAGSRGRQEPDWQTYGPGKKPCGATVEESEGTGLAGKQFGTLDQCKQLCLSNNQCTSIVWNSVDERCYLKARPGVCSATVCDWGRADGLDDDWNYYYRGDICTPSPTPAPSPVEESESDGCEHVCREVNCPCMIPWEERCQLNSCAGCPECVVDPAFGVPADYEFDVVCPGQAPTAPNLAEGHLSVASDKLESGGCGKDAAKDIVIEYKNTCQGKGVLLVNSCYSDTGYDVVIALYTKQDGVKECNDDVGAANFCHTIEAGTNDDGSFLIPQRYLVQNKYVACPGDGASHTDYGDGTGTIRCAAMGYDMEPNEVARVIVTSYSDAEGDFKITNRLHDVD